MFKEQKHSISPNLILLIKTHRRPLKNSELIPALILLTC